MISQTKPNLPAAVNINVIRKYWNDVSHVVKKEIPYYEKTVLIDPRKVTNGEPRYRTPSKHQQHVTYLA